MFLTGTRRVAPAAIVLACLASPVVTEPLIAQGEPPWVTGFAQLIRAGMGDDTIPGVVVVVVDSDRVVWSRGFGVADVATGRPADPDATLFRIGSVTKALTGLGILRLVDRGAVALDTRVATIVPLPALVGQPVRIVDLLSHTGGFDQTGLGRHASNALERPSLRAFLDAHLVPIRPPGAVATYDTYGMSLAGLAIEAASGQPYADFMRDQVFRPLGMRHTFIEAPGPDRDRLAVGYGLEAGTPVAQPYEWYTTLPASSADATASDMGRLIVALMGDGSNASGRLLRAETARALRDGAWRGGSHPFWNGWWTGRAHGHPVLYHGGVMRGYTAQLVLLPDRRAGLFVAYNRDPETGPPPRLRDQLTSAFLDHMLDDGPGNLPAEYVEVATAEFDGWWVGTLGCFTCRDGEGWPLRVERLESGGPGVVRFLGGQWRAEDTLTFRRVESGASLRFARDDSGRVRYANAGQDGFERLDSVLVARVAARMGVERGPEALRALLARIGSEDGRARAIAALAARPATVDPAGVFLLRPVGAPGSEPMRVELSRVEGKLEGWFQSRPDRPRRTIREVIVGGNEVWLVVEVPGGVLDVRLVVQGPAVTGALREGAEEVRLTGERRGPVRNPP